MPTAIMVPPLWQDPAKLSPNHIMDILVFCDQENAENCINTRKQKADGKSLKRKIRRVRTQDGYSWWSEFVDGAWHSFRMPLNLDYVKAIDDFDKVRKKFRLPKHPPFGAVEHMGLCPVITRTKEEREARAEQDAERAAAVVAGDRVVRTRKRALQTPFVTARLAGTGD